MNIEMDKILFDSGSGVTKFVTNQELKPTAMKKILLTMTFLSLCCTAAWAQFGNCTPSEMQRYVDTQTGHTITVLTDTLKHDRFLYQTDPMWTADGNYLLFRSSSRGCSARFPPRASTSAMRVASR